jgi:aryl sulfotransferase
MDRIVNDTSGDIDKDHSQHMYGILTHLRDAATRSLSTRLSAAGFDDIPEDELLVLYANSRGGAESRAVIQRLGVSIPAASQSVQTLIRHGYQKFRDNPGNPRQPMIVPTERGHAVLCETDAGLEADQWAEFPLRPGDIVISTVPKSGTTWMQMICALLIFQIPRLPAPLQQLSPWMDNRLDQPAETYAELAALKHRRFIKTHTPLNDIPADPRVTYIVVARNPLDIAVSYYHHDQNCPIKPHHNYHYQSPATARQWLLDKIDEMGTNPQGCDSYFDALLKSVSCAWERKSKPNVVLVHYEDLSADLPGEMRQLARCLDITVPENMWSSLVQAATFKQMQAAADQLQPQIPAFFRRGSSGEGRALLTEAESVRYHSRAAQIAPQDLLTWLHREDARLCIISGTHMLGA